MYTSFVMRLSSINSSWEVVHYLGVISHKWFNYLAIKVVNYLV